MNLRNPFSQMSMERVGLWSLLVLNFIAVLMNESTFDSGDSILHFIYAKQSWAYPKYFLHHWAKPFFVLLASPFAQFGFHGMQIFNAMCVSLSLVLIGGLFKIAPKASILIILVLGLSMPDLFRAQSSGLTEPLFSLLLISGIYAHFNGHGNLGVILWSFLPFVRSEGWFVIPVLAALLILNKNWKQLPLFFTATAVYSIVGWPFYGDALWVFHENPYQGVEVKYGHGDWKHYGVQMIYAMGLPLFVLLLFGTIIVLFRTIPRREFHKVELWAVVLFWSFFCAHSIFWAMGWFHSLGLRRVFIAVLPLTVIPIGYLLKPFFNAERKSYRLLSWAGLVIVLLFPFTASKMGYKLPDAFSKDVHQLAADQASKWFQTSDYSGSRVSYTYHYLTLSLGRDMDDASEVLLLNKNSVIDLPNNTVIFWDSYFSVTDAGITEDFFKDSHDYIWLRSFEVQRDKRTARIEVFYKFSGGRNSP